MNPHEAAEQEESAMVKCPYCGGIHYADQVKFCPNNPHRESQVKDIQERGAMSKHMSSEEIDSWVHVHNASVNFCQNPEMLIVAAFCGPLIDSIPDRPNTTWQLYQNLTSYYVNPYEITTAGLATWQYFVNSQDVRGNGHFLKHRYASILIYCLFVAIFRFLC